MTVMCGWINTRLPDDVAAAARRAMAASCARAAKAEAGIDTLSTSAVISAHGRIPVSQHRDERMIVALMGEVTWESEELAGVARELGNAVALAKAYAQHGAACVERMHGPFALVVADDARGKGLLAIDRMAIRTLFYAPAAGGVVFGTNANAVLAHPRVVRHVSMQGVYNYLYCECVPGPGTIFEGVSKLLPGQRLIIDGASARSDYYWQLDYDAAGAPETELREEFRSLLRDCVARAATTDNAGTFLSGGTDSSTVTGMLTRLRGRPVDTYSIGFEADGFDEMEYARVTSRHFGTRAHEYYVTPHDVAEAIPLIAAAYDEPFGNASAVPTYYCAKLAKEDGRDLLLAGDGGDELFGGNVRYAKQKVFEWYGLMPSVVRRGLVEPVLFSGPWVDQVLPLRKAKSYVQQARIPLPDRLETYNFLERESLSDIFAPDFLAAIDTHGPRTIARDAYERTCSLAAVNRMMHLDLKETLADNDLPKVNGMCELAGIAVRYPLLDDKLVAFSGRLTANQKVRGLRLRHFFKEALEDFLPAQTLAKSKHGFGLPFGIWMESDPRLREIATDALLSFKERGYVRPGYVDHLLRQHEQQHASYYGVMIWIVLMLEHWLRANDL